MYEALGKGKLVYLTSYISQLHRKNEAVREGNRDFCDVQFLPETVGLTEGYGLIFQKGSPYAEFFDKVLVLVFQ